MLSREAKDAETKSIVVELKLNDDDDDDDGFSSSSSIAVDITLLGMLMSGIVSEDDKVIMKSIMVMKDLNLIAEMMREEVPTN